MAKPIVDIGARQENGWIGEYGGDEKRLWIVISKPGRRDIQITGNKAINPEILWQRGMIEAAAQDLLEAHPREEELYFARYNRAVDVERLGQMDRQRKPNANPEEEREIVFAKIARGRARMKNVE
jgi:hypothetical protein